MNDQSRYLSESAVKELWRDFAQDLTKKKVSIQIYRRLNSWQECFAKVTGLPAFAGGGACLSRRNDAFKIHLYVSEEMWIEERLNLFLHELGHIYLDHLERQEIDYPEKDVEADAWVNVNFTAELRLIKEFVHWERHQYAPILRPKEKALPPGTKRVIREQIGDRFFVTKAQKAPLASWLTECKRKVEYYERLTKRLRLNQDRRRNTKLP